MFFMSMGLLMISISEDTTLRLCATRTMKTLLDQVGNWGLEFSTSKETLSDV